MQKQKRRYGRYKKQFKNGNRLWSGIFSKTSNKSLNLSEILTARLFANRGKLPVPVQQIKRHTHHPGTQKKTVDRIDKQKIASALIMSHVWRSNRQLSKWWAIPIPGSVGDNCSHYCNRQLITLLLWNVDKQLVFSHIVSKWSHHVNYARIKTE